MIKPEIDLELSIKSLEVYEIEPNIIKSMLSNLHKITAKINDSKLPAVSSSVISELSKEQQFYITLIARLNSELINEQIITPKQKSQIEKYIISKIQ